MAKKIDCTELMATIAEIALNYAQRPDVGDMDAVVKKVQGHLPALSRNDVVDAIVAYTSAQSKRKVSDIAKKMAKIKKEARDDVKLRKRIDALQKRIEGGELEQPGKRGEKAVSDAIRELRSIRDKLSDEAAVRDQIRKLDERIKARDLSLQRKTNRQREAALKPLLEERRKLQREMNRLRAAERGPRKPGAEAAKRRKERIANRIKELESRIAENRLEPAKRTAPTGDSETKQLRERRDALNREIGLRRDVQELGEKVESGDLSTQTRAGKPLPKNLEPLAAERDRLREQLNDARQTARQKQAIRQRIADLEAQIASGNIKAAQSRPERAADAETTRLRERRARLQREADLRRQIDDLTKQLETGEFRQNARAKGRFDEQFDELIFKRDKLRRQIDQAIEAKKPKGILERAANTFNGFRAIMTSMDLSAVLRQGFIAVASHPIRSSKALVPMLKAFRSEQFAAKVARDIENRPNAMLYEKAGLYIAPYEGATNLSAREEAWMSSWADKVPFVKGSGRAYVTFLNMIRADSFDAMVETLGMNGEVTLEEAQQIAKYINIATGRGQLHAKLENAVPAANILFFAPRNALSRIQYLYGHPLIHGNARTRKLIAKEYARFMIGFGVAVWLASMGSDDEMELDPRSTDFLKARFGNTRVDLSAQLIQPVVLATRIITGEKKTGSGRITPIRGDDVPYGGDDGADLIGRYLRYKLSPLAGTALNTITGKNPVGEKVTPGSTARDLITPMSFKEIAAAMQEHGVPKGTALSVLAIFGAGVNTYE